MFSMLKIQFSEVMLLNKIFSFVSVSVVIVILDQFVKFFLMDSVGGFNEIIPGSLNFVAVWNKGIAFGILHSLPHSDLILTVLSTFVLSFIVVYAIKYHRDCTDCVLLALIIGGGVSNLVDRVRWGAVYDFIDLYYHEWHWPAFNVADSFICVGALCFALRSCITARVAFKEL